MKKFCQNLFSTIVTTALVLTPLASLVPTVSAASFINTNVQSNASLTSGLVLQYSFDNIKVSATSITDPRYAEGFGEASESGNGSAKMK